MEPWGNCGEPWENLQRTLEETGENLRKNLERTNGEPEENL